MSITKLNLRDLSIEITRKCNANCAHCLRGEAKKQNTNKKIIRKLFENIESVQTITFTGGEPTLYTRAIRDTLNVCKELNVSVSYIYVVTNGVRYSKRLIDVMYDWLKYCMECCGYNYHNSKDLDWYLGDSLFGLSLSIDSYHPRMDERSWYYKCLPFYNDCKEVNTWNKNGSTRYIIKEGRATFDSKFSNGRYLFDHELMFSFEDDDVPDMVYCNVYGEIFPCCDMSYNRQSMVVGENNIFQRNLYDIIHDEDIDFSGELETQVV